MFWPLLRSIKDDCRGVCAIEFAFVAPLLLMLLTGIVQVGLSYFVKNHMQDVAYDITRRVAVGGLTPEQAKNYARSRLSKLGIEFSIDVVAPGEAAPEPTKLTTNSLSFVTTPTDGGSGSGSDKNTVTTVISAKAADIAHFDFMGFYDDQLIEVSASMYTD